MEDEAEIRGRKTEVVEGGSRGREGRREPKGREGVSRKDSRKFLDHQRQLRSEMRSDANERWWRTTTVSEEGRERRRERERARRTEGVIGARGTKEGAKRERSQKWRKKRNGECTQHRRVRKRAFREYRSSPLDGLSERRRRGSRGGKRLVGGDGEGGGGRRGGKGGRWERRTNGRKKKKRRFRAAAGIARLSVVKARSLCSILCASDDARLLPLGDAERGVNVADVEGWVEEEEEEVVEPVSRA